MSGPSTGNPSTRPADPNPTKVSVIVPVYNPGRYIGYCIESVLGQTLPPTEYEVIFVDDGSTDETPARLDALAAAHPNIHVIHQPNSGWPGKPRNVGIDAARGEYVFFLDHDDGLGQEALEQLYAFATRNSSDVVIGKVVVDRQGAPTAPRAEMTLSYHGLFARTRDRVTLWDAPIVDSLTPHKLFRAAFLAERGLRFPEGRRRLEDHVFVLEAYFGASVISVLADPVCYYRRERPDRGNASTGLTDPAYYYSFVRDVLAVVEAHTEPGPRRDALLQRFARVELLDRLRGPRFIGHPARYRATLFEQIRSVVEDHIPSSVDLLLAPFQRCQMALVRVGRLDLIMDAASWDRQLHGVVYEAKGVVQPASGAVALTFEVGLAAGGQRLTLEHREGRYLLAVPRDIAAIVSDDARAVVDPVPGGASIRLRRHRDSAQIAIAGDAKRRIVERKGSWMVEDRVAVTFDPKLSWPGARTLPATWDVIARIDVVGVTREVRVARLRVTADERLILSAQRSTHARRVLTEIRRYALAGLLVVSRHMDDRLRRRLWRAAVRVVRRLDD